MRGIGPVPRTDCTNAKAELAKYHWTYMNKDWGTQILDKWASQGCRPEVDRRLGYRLSLTAASFPTSVPRGTTFLAQVFLSNTGWAAPISNRPCSSDYVTPPPGPCRTCRSAGEHQGLVPRHVLRLASGSVWPPRGRTRWCCASPTRRRRCRGRRRWTPWIRTRRRTRTTSSSPTRASGTRPRATTGWG